MFEAQKGTANVRSMVSNDVTTWMHRIEHVEVQSFRVMTSYSYVSALERENDTQETWSESSPSRSPPSCSCFSCSVWIKDDEEDAALDE